MRKISLAHAFIPAIFAAFLTTLHADNAPAVADGKQYTYASDVAKIINQRCVTCHRPGQIAPISLTNFKDIRPWVKSIKKVIADRTMPPWFADPEHGDFANDGRLSDEEIKTITNWIDQGAPLGDPMDLPPVPKFRDDVWKIGRPDAVIKMPQPYVMGDEVEDRYENIIVPTGFSKDQWVTHIELRPGNFQIVHHILVFVIPPNANMKGQKLPIGGGGDGDILNAVLSGGGFLSKYAPGNNPDVFPLGAGKRIKAGSNLLFQMHYHKEKGPGTAQSDQSMVALKFAYAPIKDPVTTAWIVNPILMISPGNANYRSDSAFTFNDDGVIYSLFPHMHYRGKAFKFEAITPDGKRETLLDVPAYNFDWQISYVFKEPKQIAKGTKIVATGVFDNSAGNERNPDPTAMVAWGEATTDEMMLGLMDYAYNTDKANQGMLGLPDMVMALLPPELKKMNLTEDNIGEVQAQFGNIGKQFQGVKLPPGIKLAPQAEAMLKKSQKGGK